MQFKFGLVLVLCLASFAAATEETLTELRKQIADKGILKALSAGSDDVASQVLNEQDNSDCNCVNSTCSCCAHLKIKEIRLNENVCLNITYLPDEYGMELTLSFNDRVVYRNKVSVKNPPPICATVHEAAKLCIKFHDLDIKNKTLDGCVDAVVELAEREIAKVKLGCFHIPAFAQQQQQQAVAQPSTTRRLHMTVFQFISGGNATNTTRFNRFKPNDESLNMAFQTIVQTIKRLQELNLPKITFNFQPDKILSNLYNSFFNRLS